MLKPEEIPQYTGDLFQLGLAPGSLRADAGNVRDTGADVDAQFQGLSAFYKAPEAEQLFATTKPVKDRSESFATGLETVASALSSYGDEIRPLVTRLAELKAEAVEFVGSVAGEGEWEDDGDKVSEHNRIRDDITTAVAAFWAAERTCHNRITAVWGGTQLVAGDGTDREDQYGYDAKDLKRAKVPWGDAVEEKHHWWEIGHWGKSFLEGVFVDGVWGTVQGLGTLVGFGGWEAMGQAWKGLAQLMTAGSVIGMPVLGQLLFAVPGDKLPSWLRDWRRDSLRTAKEAGKAMLAWDEWGKNPARAGGAVVFNVVTTVFTGGSGAAASGAGKAGALARALSVAGRVGEVIDPMTYIAKAAGAGLSKVGDLTVALRGVGSVEIPHLPSEALTVPHGTVQLPDGALRLPEGAAVPRGAVRLPDGTVRAVEGHGPVLPEGTVKLPTDAGAPARYYDPQGNLLDEGGHVLQRAEQVKAESGGELDGGPAAEAPRTPSPDREPAMAGARSAAAGDQHIRLGSRHDMGLDDIPAVHTEGDVPGGGAGGHSPGGGAHEHGQGPSASHESPTSHGPSNSEHSSGGTDTPGGHGHAHQGSQDGLVGGTDGGLKHGHHSGSGAHGGSGSGGHEPARVDYSEGPEQAATPTGRMEPDQEAAVAEQLANAKMAPQDIEKCLVGLRKSEYGAGIAKYISEGKLADSPGYGELLSQCKQVSKNSDMSPAVYMALEHASDLQNQGVKGIAFEWKVPQDGLDLDVLVRSGDRIEYGVQLKDVSRTSSLNSATRGIAEKQLLGRIDGQKVAILDVHDSKAALTERILEGISRRARITNATFILRFEDGSVTIPADGPTYP